MPAFSARFCGGFRTELLHVILFEARVMAIHLGV